MPLIAIDAQPASRPLGKGQAAVASDWTHRFVAAQGGWMAGKTWVGARKLVSLHIYNAFDDLGEATYVPSVCVAPTYSNAMDFMVPELQDALRESGLAWRWRASGSIAQGRFSAPAFVLPDLGTAKNPSVILIRTAVQPERITGWQAGAGWGDEPARWPTDPADPKRDPIMQLRARVRHPRARFLQLLFTYTNEGDVTRIYEEFHSGHPDHALYTLPTKENPLAADFYEMQRSLLPPLLARQYLEGEAINMRGGKVYPDFDASKHVDEMLELSPNLPVHLALDFNIAPGMHGEIGQFWPDKDLFTVVHEIFAPRMTVRELVDEVARVLLGTEGKWRWPGPLEIFGDATGRAESASTGESCYGVLTQELQARNIPYRIRVPRANPPVVDRVNAFCAALQDAEGVVHWKCHPRCRELIADLRELNRDASGRIAKADPMRSHASDAEGYRIAYLRPARITARPVTSRISVNPRAAQNRRRMTRGPSVL